MVKRHINYIKQRVGDRSDIQTKNIVRIQCKKLAQPEHHHRLLRPRLINSVCELGGTADLLEPYKYYVTIVRKTIAVYWHSNVYEPVKSL